MYTGQSLPSKSREREREKKKKKKKKKKRWQRPGGRKKKSEEEQRTDEALRTSAHEYFLPLNSSIFSQFWWENFVGPGKKHMDPTIYFYFSSLNQTHTSKKFYIHPISLPNKHTLSVVFFTWKFDTLDPIR